MAEKGAGARTRCRATTAVSKAHGEERKTAAKKQAKRVGSEKARGRKKAGSDVVNSRAAGRKAGADAAGKVKGPEVQQGTVQDKALEPPLRPSQCRTFMRNTLAKEFREIVAGFVKGAKSGNCQHVKLTAEFLAPRARKSKAPSGKSTLERWVDELERGV